MKNVIYFLVLLLSYSQATSQLEMSNWYFGNRAAIKFDPITKIPSNVGNSALNNWEGCASISDNFGNLLFYTNGEEVWNFNNVTMENGTGLNGCYSSTQSAIIVPMPGSPKKYYVITADCNEYQRNGIRYSIVDMEKNSGQGKVTLKNQLMLENATEHICGIRHTNNTDVWVITYYWYENTFYSFLFTKNGIEKTVKSKGNLTSYSVTGCYLKGSHNGDKIVFSHGTVDAFEIFDFDNETGELNLSLTLEPFNWPYSTEFSPSGRFLYGTTNQPSKLLQFDLTLGNEKDIIDNVITIASSGETYYYSGIQIGIDNKIYISRDGQNCLGVINNPDELGYNCNFIENGLNLGSGRCRLGLPNFVNSYDYDNPEVTITSNKPLCEGDSLILEATEFENANYSWTGPDNFSSTKRIIKIQNMGAKNTGLYKVEVTLPDSSKGYASISIKVNSKPIVTINGDTLICEGDSTKLTATKNSNYSYLWSTGETSNSITVKKAGEYSVVVTNENGCDSIATVNVKNLPNPKPNISLSGYSGKCFEDSLLLKAESGFSNYEWYDENNRLVKSGSNTFYTTKAGKYYVKVKNSNGCEGISDIMEVNMFQDSNRLSFSFNTSDNIIYFDTTNILHTNCKSLTITNNGDEDFTSNDIYIYRNISYSLPQSQFPITIPARGKVEITICFSPVELGLLRDTILLEDRCSPHLIILEGYCQANDYSGSSKCDASVKMQTSDLVGESLITEYSLYPNPAAEIIDLKINTNEIGYFNINLFSITGQLLDKRRVYNSDGINLFIEKFDLHQLSRGIYYITVTAPNMKLYKDIIIKE